MEAVVLVMAVLITAAVLFFAGLIIVRNLLFIAGPNEVLIFSGRLSPSGNRMRGYRTIKGSRSLRRPLIEKVDRLDLTNMIIDVQVSNAYSKGGIPLNVQGVANLKIAGHEPLLNNAVERFLGMDRREIIKIAKDTLEGNLRGVLSALTPEEVNQDKIAFEEKLLDEAEVDLSKLGLALDTLKIQNVSDDVGYLDSIGRKQSAEVVKHARIAEAEAKAISMQRESENTRDADLAGIDAEMQITRAETARRIRNAETRKEAMVAEEQGRVRALIARAQADLAVQEARVEQVRRQLEADVVAPAQAAMEAARAEAKGRASKVIEDGRATNAVLAEMIETWKAGGVNARDIFLMQKMETLLDSMLSTIDDVEVQRITVLPSGGGGSTAARAVRMVEELKGAVGVDLPALAAQFAGRSGDGRS